MTLSVRHYQANRLDLLSRLAGDISHEIKNPLHAMVINLELVRRKVEKGEPELALERVAIVEDEIRKVHALANALLEALRPPRDQSAACGFSAVLQEIAPLVVARARLARVELRLDSEHSSALVPLPAHELRLLLLNLADRAIRVAGPGGSVAVVASHDAGAFRLQVEAGAPPLDDGERAWLENDGADAADDEDVDLGLRVVRDLVGRAGGHIAHPDGADRLVIVLPGGASA